MNKHIESIETSVCIKENQQVERQANEDDISNLIRSMLDINKHFWSKYNY
jgi:hypothetical protein